MAFFQGTVYSEALGGMTSLTVILPQALADTPWRNEHAPRPVLYLLHGLSDDHTVWVRRTNLERYAVQYGLTVIMPDGGRSFYTDMKHGGKYFQHIAEELPGIASRFFHFSQDPAETFIAGNSMGGYGALKLFLTYPERFGSCGSFSAAIEPMTLPEKFPPMQREIEDVFGTPENYKREGNDLYRLAQKCILEGRSLAPLFLSCGSGDFLIEENRAFAAHLETLNFPVSFDEEKGGHEWGFWDRKIQQFIRQLPIRKSRI